MSKKQKQSSGEDLSHQAIKYGLNKLLSSNRSLRENYSVFVMNSVDYNKIDNFLEEARTRYEKQDISPEEKTKLIYQGLADYVASAKALKDETIQTLFDKGKEGKLDRSFLEKIVNYFNPGKSKGIEYFEKARNAYADMYDILAQNEIAQEKIPELTKATESMKMYGFLDVALKNFKAHGVIDDKRYKELSKSVYETAVTRTKKGIKGLEDHILKEKQELEIEEKETGKKVAAAILGFIGTFLILSNLSMTGAVIGGDSTITTGIIGIFMIFFALLIYLRPLKKSFKK